MNNDINCYTNIINNTTPVSPSSGGTQSQRILKQMKIYNVSLDHKKQNLGSNKGGASRNRKLIAALSSEYHNNLSSSHRTHANKTAIGVVKIKRNINIDP